MKDKRIIRDLAIAAAIIALLFWNPATRSVILFILPLGSGIDDLIFMVAALFATVFGVFFFLHKRKGLTK